MLIDFRTLFPKYNIQPKGVLHVGANVGEEAPVYHELGVYKQIWIEANPNVYDHLKLNLRAYRDAECINACIGDEEGKEVMFHVSNNGSQSSSFLELGTHKTQHPDVHYVSHMPMKIRRIDKLFPYSVYGDMMSRKIYLTEDYDFLNIDIQGCEAMALRGMGQLLHQFKWVYLEVNSDHVYEGCALLPEIEIYLMSFGFKRAELKWASANLTWGDCLFIR